VAAYAVKRLLALDFTGHNVQDLLGAQDVTYTEIARVYGAAIGKPDLKYMEFPYADFKQSLLTQVGASESVADNFSAFIKVMNEDQAMVAQRDSESTTPTTIEDFAATFAYVYNLQ
jgi:uncharacterized protein YbjT (DUF2867 family)